jgi:dolichyl-phosphate beta-glucosyltransferase
MPSLAFSVILPAFDEARRLPPYLGAIRSYLDGASVGQYEVIVVDDGSGDATAELVTHLARQWPQLRLLRHARNEGKGAAVRTGMLAAQGETLLFADADGAAPIEECARLAAAIAAGADVAVGSRLVPDVEVIRTREWHRGLVGRLFAVVARRLLGIDVLDTQCGFKLFRADAAKELFAAMREKRYLFDLELLLLAKEFQFKVVEVPIRWHEVSGGHMRLTAELPRIVAGLCRMRTRRRQLRSGRA